MTSRGLKYWGGMTFAAKGQCRAVVAATTKKAAMEALGVRRSEFERFWCETGNAVELSALRYVPHGTVLYQWERGRTYLTLEELEVLTAWEGPNA